MGILAIISIVVFLLIPLLILHLGYVPSILCFDKRKVIPHRDLSERAILHQPTGMP